MHYTLYRNQHINLSAEHANSINVKIENGIVTTLILTIMQTLLGMRTRAKNGEVENDIHSDR